MGAVVARSTSGVMPDLVPPMQPAAGRPEPPAGADWVVEVAWTGHRCIAYVHPGRVRLLSSGDHSVTAAFPELAEPLLTRAPRRGMVLDGTLVARAEGRSSRPRLLQRRTSVHRPSESLVRRIPVDLLVADLLWIDGRSTVDLPYRYRRALLEELKFDSAPVWTTSSFPAAELAAIMPAAEQYGVDALHVRHLEARYRPGGSSQFWVRVPVRRTRAVVVGGWTPTDPRRPDSVGALLLGVPTGEGLRYVGRVGLTAEEGRHVADALPALHSPRSPFVEPPPPDAGRHAAWLAPQLLGWVEFTGWSGDGRLRLPAWRGVAAADVVDEAQWARPPGLDEPTGPDTAAAEGDTAGVESAEAEPSAVDGEADSASSSRPTDSSAADPVESRRLEQHFVYNSLNTIASLVRTDPSRARELLLGFADLTRATDRPAGATTTLGDEMATVQAYLRLEQARFGKRLRVDVSVGPELHAVPVSPMAVLSAVRATVQQQIEPRPGGGTLTVTARAVDDGCEVDVAAADGASTRLRLRGSGPDQSD